MKLRVVWGQLVKHSESSNSLPMNCKTILTNTNAMYADKAINAMMTTGMLDKTVTTD